MTVQIMCKQSYRKLNGNFIESSPPLGNDICNDKSGFLVCPFYKRKILSDYYSSKHNIKTKLCFNQA